MALNKDTCLVRSLIELADGVNEARALQTHGVGVVEQTEGQVPGER